MRLLYDRLLRWATTHRYTEDDATLLARLRRAQVFELSDLVPLMPDWEQARQAPISKRPPYPVVWSEWFYDDIAPEGHAYEGQVERWQMGALLWQLESDTVRQLMVLSGQDPEVTLFTAAGEALPEIRHKVGEDFWTCDEFYMARSFMLVTKPGPWTTLPMNTLCWQLGYTCYGMRREGTVVRTTGFYDRELFSPSEFGLDAESWQQRLRERSPFRLSMLHSVPTKDRYWPFVTPWPALMASALLHCKNVTSDHVTPAAALSAKQRRHLQRRGEPEPVAYKVLRLRVPEEQPVAQSRTSSPSESASVRLHLCRGHFKQLTHPRYKHPGLYWWPAHWRGDPAAGITLKDYVLSARAS